MNRFIIFLICIFITACAANKNEKTTISGKRISKEEAEKLNLKPAGTFQDLINDQFKGLPKPGSFQSCLELIDQLKEKNITIQTIEEKKVVAVNNENKLLTYSFSEGSCLR
ncbi:hypothetical protein J3L16_15630 [Alteromonas sp. 5E99-2]|uniref:hypothetical protein n=1 Tax=Alteromonas sp. 5E99-2 TaxID=2817683 RepID=UPI001A99FAE9|nr:hypothetical protein [Alteromonas sp. 5E99-2]MBO1257113.1 hypothetical protein [Alteromonas sp. 5E99-2]